MTEKELSRIIEEELGTSDDELLLDALNNIDDNTIEKIINDLDEEEKEELFKMVDSTLGTQMSIKDALIASQKEQQCIKDSFDITFSAYSTTNKLRMLNIHKLRLVKIRMQLLKIYSLFVNNGSYSILYNIEQKLNESVNDMHSQRNEFKEIKKNLKLLKKQKNDICNFEICKLIALMFKRNELIIKDLNDYIYESNCNLKGFRFSSFNNNEEMMKEINESIYKTKLTLGLTNR